MPFFATCPKGLEYLLRDELVHLGALDVREALAGVYFNGSLETAYRACLWSRLASRILMPLSEFDAADDASLYAGVEAIDWAVHLDPQGTLAVDAVSIASTLRHTRFLEQRVKDAIVDQFRQRCASRPDVDLQQPSIRLNLLLRRDRATLSLDLSGTPLHRRGYRVGQGAAPLKENLACAMLIRAGWPEVYASGGGLIDPMCGSGTLLIEAIWMAADRAPGLQRDYFGFLGWRGHDANLWQSLLEQARERAEKGTHGLPACFYGYDHHVRVIAEAQQNAQAAGVENAVQFICQDIEHLQQPVNCEKPGLVISNPPYGERLGTQENLGPLYHNFGQRLQADFLGWRAAIITSDDDLARATGLRAAKRYALYNGAIECRFFVFNIQEKASASDFSTRPLTPGAESVANRIRKTVKHVQRRLLKEGITSWRVYDADIPEYAAAIDIYTEQPNNDGITTPQRWLHIQEYAPPRDIPEDVARRRLNELVHAASVALDVPSERIATKVRYRAKGGSKYGRLAAQGKFIEVQEEGLRFLVNLHDYLDTGLFLDHRPLRAYIRQRAADKRILNLFCYTATASVFAAAGGARSTTSVDLSATYLDWAMRNLQLNGFIGQAHTLLQADCLEWLAHDRDIYDLIYVDPPTFSNSKRADDFDVQRDHVHLLKLCAARLAPGGLILFSNNNRRFRLQENELADFSIRDISASTIPFDFSRNSRIHCCYEIGKQKP